MNYVKAYIRSLRRLIWPRRERTVRYMFPVMLGIGGALTAAAILSGDSSFIRLEANKSIVEAGETFSVHVYAFAHVPVNAIDVMIEYDERDVDVTGVDTGQSVITLWTEEPEARDGAVRLSGGTYQRGFRDEHLIAIINFRAKQSGQTNFNAENARFLAGDGTGDEVGLDNQRTDRPISLYIYDEDEDPSSLDASVAVRIKTDVNNDGRISLQDISIFMSAWSSRSTVYDFNNDGRMTFRDFSIILADYFFQ